jgi:DNA-binding protein H-NS
MTTLAELLAQKAQLEKQIEAAKTAEQTGAIKQIVAIAGEYGITYADLKPHMIKQRRRRRTRAEIEAAKG